MRAGTLRHRITIQQATTSPDAAGQPIATWSDWLPNEPAEVLETAGAETVRGVQVSATATHVVRVRFRDGYGEQLRIVWGTRILGVVNARDVDGRRRELWISAREGK